MEELTQTASILLGTVLGGVISLASNFILEQKKLEREIKLINKNKIDEAYKEIFYALILLKKYYVLFINSGNEFKENKNFKEFSPLNKIIDFNECVDKNLLYLDNKLLKKIEKLKYKILFHKNIAVMLQTNYEDFAKNEIEKISSETIEEIETIIEFIKKRFID